MHEIDLHNEDTGSAPQQKKVWVDPVCVPVEIVLETRNLSTGSGFRSCSDEGCGVYSLWGSFDRCVLRMKWATEMARDSFSR
jgi:hypothetical protein